MNNKKKNSPLKKILKWFFILVLVVLIALVSIPFLFKDKIKEIVARTINENVNATVTFKDIDLSLLKSFPLANLTIEDISIANKAPFLGDTLYVSKELSVNMNIKELFKTADETINLKSISTRNGKINIIVNDKNIGNYDIAIPNEKVVNDTSTNDPFSFNISNYEVENIDFLYVDEISKMKVGLSKINHSGNGNFANDILDLDTNSETFLSFEMDGVNYMNNLKITLDAIIGIDLKNSKYTFKENTGYINQLPLEFNGFIQLFEESQLYDINFKTPTSTFKNALALIPEQYSGNLNSIKTEGNFDLNGVVKGTLSEKTIPTFNISLLSKNAMFKYADLPKSVENINIDTKVINTTGAVKDTYVNLNNLTFTIDEDEFTAKGNVANITTNPKINMAAKGVVNLANIGKVYPLALTNELAGILKADITTNFDMNSVEKGTYQNIKNEGNIAVTNFKYEGEDVAKPFIIDKTSITFNTNTIKLNEFKAKTGTSDLSINGSLDNFYGFIFKNQILKGNFNLNSTNLNVSDFISKTSTETTKKEETTASTVKIPAFIDATFNANAKNVVYDNIILKNVSGNLYIKDENINLKNVKSDVFGGNIAFNGNVSTKENISNFNMDLNFNELNIADSFSTVEMLKSIAPIAKTIEGKINSTINVSGNLNDDMTPNLKTISGNLLGQLLNTKLKASNSKVLSALGNKVAFLDVSKLNLDKIQTYIAFKDGAASIKPFQLNYKDIGITIGGKHGFDQSINYDLTFDVPVKYLGTEVTNLITKLAPKDAETVKSIPVKGSLSGSFSSPSFTTNLKDATTSLVNDLIEKQKQSLINKGKDALTDLINKNKTTTDKDSTKTKTKTEEKVRGLLNGLFKKKTDTTNK
ncbi:AsmA family protein [Polaribacter sp.]|uniref:AsmA family protein n=1 Tax=Polaribacter sp. TaxID=1920175 RepID=UPI003EF8932A